MSCELEKIYWLNSARLTQQHLMNALSKRNASQISDDQALNLSRLLSKRLLFEQARVLLPPLAENPNQQTNNNTSNTKMQASKKIPHPRPTPSMISMRRLSLRPKETIKLPRLSPMKFSGAYSDSEDKDFSLYREHRVAKFERQLPEQNRQLPKSEQNDQLLKKPEPMLQLSTKVQSPCRPTPSMISKRRLSLRPKETIKLPKLSPLRFSGAYSDSEDKDFSLYREHRVAKFERQMPESEQNDQLLKKPELMRQLSTKVQSPCRPTPSMISKRRLSLRPKETIKMPRLSPVQFSGAYSGIEDKDFSLYREHRVAKFERQLPEQNRQLPQSEQNDQLLKKRELMRQLSKKVQSPCRPTPSMISKRRLSLRPKETVKRPRLSSMQFSGAYSDSEDVDFSLYREHREAKLEQIRQPPESDRNDQLFKKPKPVRQVSIKVESPCKKDLKPALPHQPYKHFDRARQLFPELACKEPFIPHQPIQMVQLNELSTKPTALSKKPEKLVPPHQPPSTKLDHVRQLPVKPKKIRKKPAIPPTVPCAKSVKQEMTHQLPTLVPFNEPYQPPTMPEMSSKESVKTETPLQSVAKSDSTRKLPTHAESSRKLSDMPLLDDGQSEEPISVFLDTKKRQICDEKPYCNKTSSQPPILNIPSSTEPIVSILNSTEPIVSIPSSTEPIVSVPSSTEPIVSTPSSTEPIVSIPSSTEPIVSIPSSIEPIINFPSNIEHIISIPNSLQSNINIPSTPKLNVSVPSSSEMPVIIESNVPNDVTMALEQLNAEQCAPLIAQTLIPPEQFVTYTSLDDIVQSLNLADSIVSSQSSIMPLGGVLSPSTASTPHERNLDDQQPNFNPIVLLKRCNVTKHLARLRKNKKRREVRALKRQQALAALKRTVIETPKFPVQLCQTFNPTEEHVTIAAPVINLPAAAPGISLPAAAPFKYLPAGRKDMTKAMEAANLKPQKPKVRTAKPAPRMTQYTEPHVLKRGRGRPPKNTAPIQKTPPLALIQKRRASNMSHLFEDIEMPTEDDLHLEESCLKLASFLEDDSMEINLDDDFNATTYETRLKNVSRNGRCCCCTQRYIASTHCFKHVPVPPIAHANNMFRPRRSEQSQPERTKKSNTPIDLKPLDLSFNSPKRNETFENSSDTGFDSPHNCEVWYGGFPVSRPVALQPFAETFGSSTPRGNRFHFNLEPMLEMSLFQTVDQVHESPDFPATNGFISNLTSVSQLPSLQTVDQVHESPDFPATNGFISNWTSVSQLPSLQTVDQVHGSPADLNMNVEPMPVLSSLQAVEQVHESPTVAPANHFDVNMVLNIEGEKTVDEDYKDSPLSNQRYQVIVSYNLDQAVTHMFEPQNPEEQQSALPEDHEITPPMDAEDHETKSPSMDAEDHETKSPPMDAEDHENTPPMDAEDHEPNTPTPTMDEDILSIYGSDGSLSPILDEPMTVFRCKPLQYRDLNRKEEPPINKTNVYVSPLQMPSILPADQSTTSLPGYKIPKRNNNNNTSLADNRRPDRVPPLNFQNTESTVFPLAQPLQAQPAGLRATRQRFDLNLFGYPCIKFLTKTCPHAFGCKFSHSPLPAAELIQKKLWSMSPEDVSQLFATFVGCFPTTLQMYFSIFCDYFIERRRPLWLLEMVWFCAQNITGTELLIYFTRIAAALQRCGYKQGDAVNQIIQATPNVTHSVTDALIELCTTNNETIYAAFEFLQQWAIVLEYQFPVNCVKRLIDSVLVSKDRALVTMVVTIMDRIPAERVSHIRPAITEFVHLVKSCNLF